MFDFEKLEVYKKSKEFNSKVLALTKSCKIDIAYKHQLIRASLSIPINIAEGSGRFSRADKRNFFVISRSSVFECVSILDILKEEIKFIRDEYKTLYDLAEQLSKILYTMIRDLEKK